MDNEDFPISALAGLQIDDVEAEIKRQLQNARTLMDEVATFTEHNNSRNRQGKTECRHIIADIKHDAQQVEMVGHSGRSDTEVV